MLGDMVNIAVQSLRHPTKQSVWIPELGRYVAPDSEEGRAALAQARTHSPTPGNERRRATSVRPAINPQFKLVFLTAALGTLLFLLLCGALVVFAGRSPTPLVERFITTTLDLAKIGFGSIVGLLGGKSIQGEAPAPEPA